MNMAPAILAARTIRNGTTSLFGTLILQKVRFPSKNPLMQPILLACNHYSCELENELSRLLCKLVEKILKLGPRRYHSLFPTAERRGYFGGRRTQRKNPKASLLKTKFSH
jgi:hypothetical protein